MKKEELIKAAAKDTMVFIGPTAAGKDTIMRCIAVEADLPILVSCTTRPMRDGEIDGVEYYFINDDEFDNIDMVESRYYHTAGTKDVWKYGLSEFEAEEHGLLILDWQGYLDFKQWRAEKGLPEPIAVYVEIDKEKARTRQQRRGDYNIHEFERRWKSDMSWTGIAKEESRYVWENKDSIV